MSILTNIRRRFGDRTAVVAAGSVVFALGAGSLVAATQDEAPASGTDGTSATVVTDDTVTGDTVTDDTVTDDTVTDDDATDDTVTTPTTDDHDHATTSTTDHDERTTPTTDDDDEGTTPTTDDDDHATTSTADDPDDTTTSTADDPDDTTTSTIDDDDATTSTIDDDVTTSTIDHDGGDLPRLPGAFTEVYTSTGGAITVSWNGTSFSLDSISPAIGYGAEIEHLGWDRVRVDFESGDDDHRIEVRLDDGAIRIRID